MTSYKAHPFKHYHVAKVEIYDVRGRVWSVIFYLLLSESTIGRAQVVNLLGVDLGVVHFVLHSVMANIQ